ncbi:MAG: glycosyltransferase family 4 protein [Eubacteriales bacterium]|nr:glycosyltransferase family 4 protein [Eubacteriales bacterium]
MRKILIIMGRYLPGYKDGGPVRSIKNLTDYLGDEYEFRILTTDRDHGDTDSYPAIKKNSWNRVGKAMVYYVRPGGFRQKLIIEISEQADMVYVCGCFSDYSITTLILKRIRQIKKPVVIASMGLFMPNAMKKKPLKYKSFITVFRCLGMFNNIMWSCSSGFEAECTRNIIGKRARCFIAEDLPRMVNPAPIIKSKKTGELRVFFISRISPEKNLLQTIEILKLCKGNIWFTIYGPVHNESYWENVKQELKKLPGNIHAEYKGNIESENVIETLKKEHVFLFTTIGENFSHVTQEALSAGCPCVISDQTPWNDLEENGCGFVLPLKDNKAFAKKIDQYALMDEPEFQRAVHAAHSYAIKVSNNKVKNTGYRKIFNIE